MNTPALKEWPLWEIFVRSKQGLEHKHCGSLHAADAAQALHMARDVYTRRQEGVSIWVVPSIAITASNPDDKGELFDPAADKILTAAALISLVELDGGNGRPLAPAWMVAAMMAREFAVSALRSFAATEGQVIPASWSGKVKTTTQIVAISFLIIYDALGEFRHLAPILLWIALITTILSGVEYFARYAHLVYRSGTPSSEHRTTSGPKSES